MWLLLFVVIFTCICIKTKGCFGVAKVTIVTSAIQQPLLEDLKFLRHSPDLFNNVKVGKVNYG